MIVCVSLTDILFLFRIFCRHTSVFYLKLQINTQAFIDLYVFHHKFNFMGLITRLWYGCGVVHSVLDCYASGLGSVCVLIDEVINY